jgi:hypothetical protein
MSTKARILANAANFTAQSLTDAATISWDWTMMQSAKVTITGNRTLANPTNAEEGQYAALVVNRTGSFALSFGNAYKGISSIIQSSVSGRSDHFVFRYDGTNFQLVSFRSNVGA